MSTGQLFLRPRHVPNQNGRDESKMSIDFEQRQPQPQPQPQPQLASKKNDKGTTHDKKKKGGNKKKKPAKGGGDIFRIQGNNISGGKADRVGVFGFGNKYIGHKKQQEEEDDDSTDEENGSSEDEQ